MRLRIDFDLFSLVIIAFFTVLIVTHKKKPRVVVTKQAITATEDLGTIDLPAADPMNDDNPNGRAIRALEKVERAESDRVLARAYGVPVEHLHWTPVSPGYVGKRLVKR